MDGALSLDIDHRAAAEAGGQRTKLERVLGLLRCPATRQPIVIENDTLVLHTRSIALDTGRVPVDITERGPLPELFATFERIARRIAGSPIPSMNIERLHPPVAVFEDFIKGLLAETPATAIAYLNAALKGCLMRMATSLSERPTTG